VALPGVVVGALEQHLATFTGFEVEAPVFTGPEDSPLRRATFSRAWREAVGETGAPEGLRPHDLRHHAATLTAQMPGVTTKELMARIGHASPRAALIYQHATRERDRAIASYLEDVVAAAEPTPRAPVADLAGPSRGAAVGLDG
jgi:integrase